jgi:ADP-ribose pyrophosphatase YjhB (NUDIX family)
MRLAFNRRSADGLYSGTFDRGRTMQVKVRAAIWADDGLLIHEERRQGHTHRTLPGGRVRDAEPLADALRREVDEELGLAVRVGALRYVAEVVHGHGVHDLNLVFDAEPAGALPAGIRTVRSADDGVLPPILGEVLAGRGVADPAPRWLGNVWRARS